jgi:hypothetical protein
MTALLQRCLVLGEAVVDLANPLLVRHVRQELRNRGFIGVFMLLLLAAVLASLFMAGSADARGEGEAGRWLFGLLGVTLSFALWVAQPISAFRAMMRERDEDTWDLIDLTGMSPGQILRGVLLATLVQGTLYTAAIAPFMVMAYLLRGLDLLTVLLITLGLVLLGALISTFAIFWGCLGPNKATRAVLFVLLILMLMIGWFSSWGIIIWLARGELAAAFASDPVEAWIVLAMWVNAWLAAMALLLVLAATLLTFRAGNRSTVPRLVWLGIAVNATLWVLAATIAFDGLDRLDDVLVGIGIMLTLWALPLGLFAATEDRELSPRQARWITEASPARSLVSWFLGPGSARGTLCFLLLAGVAIAWAGIGSLIEDQREGLLLCLVLIGHLGFYLGATRIVGNTLLAGYLDTSAARRVFCLALMIVFSVAQLMVQLIVDHGFLPLNVLSPIWAAIFVSGEFNLDSGALESATAFGVVVVSGSGFALLLIQAIRGLPIRTVRVHARADDRNPRGG